MTIDTSKLYDFNPPASSILLTAFQRAGLRPGGLTATHIREGQAALNYILSELSNIQPSLWEISLISIPLRESVATYSVPAETVQILDLYISYGDPQTDRYLYPLSRTEYASIPNKDNEAFPNQFWFSRLISPTVTFWPVPDGNGPYVARYYSVRQTQDAVLANGKTVEIPYRWLDCYTSGVAWKLAELYSPQLEDKLFSRYTRALNIATTQDVENVALYIQPGLSGYYR